MQKKRLDKKDKVNLKTEASQPGWQTIATNILANISRIKGNPDNEIWSINGI